MFAIKIGTIHLVNATLCPCCPMISALQLTSAPLWHLTNDSNQRQGEPVWWCFALTNSSLKQEALPSCRDPQSSSNHQWWLWCSVQLMAHCRSSLFTSTWAGWHSSTFLLCYQNKCVILFRGLDWRWVERLHLREQCSEQQDGGECRVREGLDRFENYYQVPIGEANFLILFKMCNCTYHKDKLDNIFISNKWMK